MLYLKSLKFENLLREDLIPIEARLGRRVSVAIHATGPWPECPVEAQLQTAWVGFGKQRG